jgi:hypothetical protein
MRKDTEMTAGLPGTGIGGIFYFLLVVCMPIREFFRTLQGRTTLKRWCFIALQLFFVIGILAAMWGEVWLLNRLLLLLPFSFGHCHFFVGKELTFEQSKVLAVAAATAGFISLTFVLVAVYIVRILVCLFDYVPAKANEIGQYWRTGKFYLR